jgi:hypothetical protein
MMEVEKNLTKTLPSPPPPHQLKCDLSITTIPDWFSEI